MLSAFTITGDRELDAKLRALGEKEGKKAVRSAITQGMTVLLRSMRSRVPAQYKDAKQALGKRYAKSKGGANRGQQEAKVGAGVGVKRKGKRSTRAASGTTKRVRGAGGRFQSIAAGSGSGVGISKENIHWFILGTKPRATKKGSRNRGTMPAVLADVVKGAYEQAGPAAQQKMLAILKQKIEQAARK